MNTVFATSPVKTLRSTRHRHTHDLDYSDKDGDDVSLEATVMSSTSATTNILILLVSASLMAVIFTTGIAMGYYGFYTHFKSQYMSQLSDTNYGHNMTLEILSSKLQEVLVEKDAAEKEASELFGQINELRGRLESQSNLASAHRDLLVKHQSLTGQYRQYINASDIKIEGMQAQLQNTLASLKEQEEYWKSQLLVTEQSTTALQKYISRRENTLCRQWFKDDGPYRVEFVVGGSDHDSSTGMSFVVEITKRARRYLPHTVYTFLTLVESMTYSKAKMSFVGFSSDQKVLEIGSTAAPVSEDDDDMMSYLRRLGYHDVGHDVGRGVLAFLERPPVDVDVDEFLCDQNSLGFIQHGPSLKLFLGNDAEWGNDGSNSICFGRIVQGHDTTVPAIEKFVIEERKQLQIHSISYIPPYKYRIVPPPIWDNDDAGRE